MSSILKTIDTFDNTHRYSVNPVNSSILIYDKRVISRKTHTQYYIVSSIGMCGRNLNNSTPSEQIISLTRRTAFSLIGKRLASNSHSKAICGPHTSYHVQLKYVYGLETLINAIQERHKITRNSPEYDAVPLPTSTRTASPATTSSQTVYQLKFNSAKTS